MLSNKKHKRNKETRHKAEKQNKSTKLNQNEWWHTNISAFIYESLYQIVTWVCIGLSLGGIYYFYSQRDFRFVMWSSVALLCSILVMIGLLADRHLFHGEDSHSPKDNAFSVVVATTLGTEKRAAGGGLWLAHQPHAGALTLSPIQRSVFIRLTNMQTVRSMIETYRIDVMNARNIWTQLIHIDPSRGTVYMAPSDLSSARILDTKQMFDFVIQGKSIFPRETIEGWAFFEIPEDLEFRQPVRIYVKDFGGAELTKEIPAPELGTFAQNPGIHILGGPINLKDIAQTYYSDAMRK